MELRKLFPRVIVACLALALWSTSAFTQTRARVTTSNADANEIACSPEELAALTAVTDSKPVWEAKQPKPPIDLAPSTAPSSSGFIKFEPLLLSAIDERLGSRYRWGALWHWRTGRVLLPE